MSPQSAYSSHYFWPQYYTLTQWSNKFFPWQQESAVQNWYLRLNANLIFFFAFNASRALNFSYTYSICTHLDKQDILLLIKPQSKSSNCNF